MPGADFAGSNPARVTSKLDPLQTIGEGYIFIHTAERWIWLQDGRILTINQEA